MYFSSIECGDKVELKYIHPEGYSIEDGNLGEGSFLSEVCAVYEGRTIDILMPIFDGKMILLQVGKRFDVCFSGEKGVYTATAVATRRYKRGSLPILTIAIEGKVDKVQRRENYRFKTALDVAFKAIDPDSAEAALKAERVDKLLDKYGVTIDLSAGGMKFIASEPIDLDTTLLMEVEVPNEFDGEETGVKFSPRRDGSASELQGKKESYLYAVFVVIDCALNSKGYYEIRGCFSNIEKNDREKIIRLIFWLERKLRKREKQENA